MPKDTSPEARYRAAKHFHPDDYVDERGGAGAGAVGHDYWAAMMPSTASKRGLRHASEAMSIRKLAAVNYIRFAPPRNPASFNSRSRHFGPGNPDPRSLS